MYTYFKLIVYVKVKLFKTTNIHKYPQINFTHHRLPIDQSQLANYQSRHVPILRFMPHLSLTNGFSYLLLYRKLAKCPISLKLQFNDLGKRIFKRSVFNKKRNAKDKLFIVSEWHDMDQISDIFSTRN